jgi:hypothetical protein
MKIIKIKDCSECQWHYDLSRMFGNKEASVLCYHPKIRPAFKPIPNYPTIPDWCELEEVEEGKEKK